MARLLLNRGGFSWKRAVGISGAKAKLSRKIGVPLTKSGRQRKYGAAMGCATFLLVALTIVLLAGVALSHPGRTDKYGGHTDSKTGVYHYHGGASAPTSLSSYAASTTVSEEPVLTIDDLMAQLREAWLVGELERAMALCDQIKIALAEERVARAVEEAPEVPVQSLQSPVSFDAGGGITGTIEFPMGTAYITTETYVSSASGDRKGIVAISIPGAISIDNKYFKAKDILLTAEFSSSDPSVVYVSEGGRMAIKDTGLAVISVSIGNARTDIPIVVVKLPISTYSSKIEVVKVLGFPDETRTYGGIGSIAPDELWRWNRYPGLCLRMGSVSVSVYSEWGGNLKSIWK